MALDKILKIYDGDGNEVDYDILANDVKFQDGVDLPSKIAEMEEDISEAGTGNYTKPADGIPATDLDASVNESLDKADTAYQKPASGIPSTDMTQAVQDALAEAASAVQPGDSIPATDVTGLASVATSGDYDDLSNKPTIPDTSGLATKQEVNTGLAGKADKSDTYTKAQTDAAIQEAVEDLGGQDGITPHIDSATGNWFIGNTNTGVRARGYDGVQSGDDVVVVNDLLGVPSSLEEGQVAVLGAAMGKVLKDELDASVVDVLDSMQSNSPASALSARQGKLIYEAINTLLSSLRPSAFWDGVPDIDWIGNVTKFNITYNVTGCSKGNSATLVSEGGSLVAQFSPVTGYTLLNVTPTVSDGGSPVGYSRSYNSVTGVLTITIRNITNDITIGVAANILRNVSLQSSSLTWDGPSSVPSGGELAGYIRANSNYALPTTTPTVNGTHGTVAYDSTTGLLIVSNVTSDITIVAEGVSAHSVTFNGTNVEIDNTNGVTNGGTFSAILTPRTSAKESATVTWSVTSVIVTMGGQTVQNAFDPSDNTITVQNVTDDIAITAVAESSFKIHKGSGMTMGNYYPTSDINSDQLCYTDYIKLPDTIGSSATVTWHCGWQSISSDYQSPLSLTLLDSSKKISVDSTSYVPNGMNKNSITSSSRGRTFNISSGWAGGYIRCAMFMENGDIQDECYVEISDGGTTTRLFTAEQGLDSLVETSHAVTFNLGNSIHVNSNSKYIGKVFDGKNLAVGFAAQSGYKIDSVVVTMGGTDISANVVTGSVRRYVNIPSVTGAVVITVNTSAS